MGNSLIQNYKQRVLFNVIAEYLSEHPTTLESIGPKVVFLVHLNLKMISNQKKIPKVKGFKMNTIVPIHSNLTLKHPMTNTFMIQNQKLQLLVNRMFRKSQKESNENKRLNGFSSCIIYNKYLMIYIYCFGCIYMCVCACLLISTFKHHIYFYIVQF